MSNQNLLIPYRTNNFIKEQWKRNKNTRSNLRDLKINTLAWPLTPAHDNFTLHTCVISLWLLNTKHSDKLILEQLWIRLKNIALSRMHGWNFCGKNDNTRLRLTLQRQWNILIQTFLSTEWTKINIIFFTSFPWNFNTKKTNFLQNDNNFFFFTLFKKKSI